MEEEILEIMGNNYKENAVEVLKTIYSSFNKYMKVWIIAKYKFKIDWYGELL